MVSKIGSFREYYVIRIQLSSESVEYELKLEVTIKKEAML